MAACHATLVIGACRLILNLGRRLLGNQVNAEHAGEVTAREHHHLLHVALALLTLPDLVH